MKNKRNASTRRDRPPIITIIVSSILAGFAYATTLFEGGGVVTIALLAALVAFIIFSLLRNYYIYVKPMAKLSASVEQYASDCEDAILEFAVVKSDLEDGHNTANRLLALSWEYSEAYKNAYGELGKIATSSRRLFADSARRGGRAR